MAHLSHRRTSPERGGNGKYMQIGELAHQTGLSTRQLRYWTQHGLLRERRTTNGYRAYDEDAPTRARRIHALLEAGLTMKEIKRITGCLDLDQGVCKRERELLKAKHAELEERITCLRHAQDLIGEALNR